MSKNNLNININFCGNDSGNGNQDQPTIVESGSEVRTLDRFWLEQAMGTVNHPDDIDQNTKKSGLEPVLLNPYFAQKADLSSFNIPGVKKGLAIPVQITNRKEGRNSIFYAEKGKPVNDMMIATSSGMIISEITRISGDKDRAKAGDGYQWQLKTLTGKTIFSLNGKLDSISKTGEGKLILGGNGNGEPGGVTSNLTVVIICTWLSLSKEVQYVYDGLEKVTVIHA